MKLEKAEKELKICHSQLGRERKRAFDKVQKEIPKAAARRRSRRKEKEEKEKEEKRLKELSTSQREKERQEQEDAAHLEQAITDQVKRDARYPYHPGLPQFTFDGRNKFK